MTAALAQDDAPNGVLLVARPDMPDPRFRETVVLVTQAPDGHTVGVVLNRPPGKLSEFVPGATPDREVRYGGPVLGNALVALFRSERPPEAPAFHVLRNVYLSMHPRAVEPIVAGDAPGARLYAGFCGWTPGQLEREMQQEGWYMLPASEAIVFREDTSGMWRELLEKARGLRTRAPLERRAILG